MRRILLATVAACAVTNGGLTVQASPSDDQAGPNWRPASELQGQLTSRGWQVHSIEAEKGQYEVEGVNPQGQYVEAYYDPRTLQQTSSKVKGGPGYYGKPKKDKRRDVDEPAVGEGKSKDKGKDKDRGGKGGGGGKGK